MAALFYHSGNEVAMLSGQSCRGRYLWCTTLLGLYALTGNGTDWEPVWFFWTGLSHWRRDWNPFGWSQLGLFLGTRLTKWHHFVFSGIESIIRIGLVQPRLQARKVAYCHWWRGSISKPCSQVRKLAVYLVPVCVSSWLWRGWLAVNWCVPGNWWRGLLHHPVMADRWKTSIRHFFIPQPRLQCRHPSSGDEVWLAYWVIDGRSGKIDVNFRRRISEE